MIVICIRSIVKNKAIDLYRERKKELSFDAECIADISGIPEELVIKKEDRERMDKALLELPEENRDALTLVYAEGYSYAEAADLIGISEDAIRGRLYRAKIKLKNIMEGMGLGNEKR